MSSSRDAATVDTHGPQAGDAAPRPSRPALLETLGRYRIKRLLGTGGMGAVYEAEDPELGRSVAIKVLRPDGVGQSEQLKREAQSLARLVHPNVVAVYDVGEKDGEVFVVMQFVDGVTIDRYLEARAADVPTVVSVYLDAGEGLAAAHAVHLVHCDFKPGNVLVDTAGVVRVTDFGVARRPKTTAAIPMEAISGTSMTMAVAGTPAYMAPEQASGFVTTQSDQYAFCVALWEALAGERPFADPALDSLEPAALRARPLRDMSRLPPALARVLAKGLAGEPDDRYPSMRALLDALAPFAAPRRRSSRWPLVLGGLVVTGGAVAAVVALAARDRVDVTRTPVAAPTDASLPPRDWPGADVGAVRQLTQVGADGCAYAPVVVGRDVVFDYATTTRASDLYAISLAGTSLRPLTTAPTREWRPARGRTETEVAYLVQSTASERDARIAYLDVVTQTTTTAVSILAYGVAAGGRSLFYAPDSAPILRRLHDGQDDQLAAFDTGNLYQLAASPTGDHVVALGTDSDDICLVTVATASKTCWTTGSDQLARPAFSPDGRFFYYTREQGIVRREVATGVEVVAVRGHFGPGGLAISPAGDTLVYSTCDAQPRLVDVTTGQLLLPSERWPAWPAFGPGGAMAWLRQTEDDSLLAVRTPDGRVLTATKATDGTVASPAFSADGKRVAFQLGDARVGIWVVDLDVPGRLVQVSSGKDDAWPAWTTDGRIAFERGNSDGAKRIYLGSPDGEEPVPVGIGGRSLYAARGTELLVGSTDKLFWLDVTTGKERPGPPRPPGYLLAASISPGGEWIVFQTEPDGQTLWRARVGEAPLLFKQYADGYSLEPPRIRDDGSVVAQISLWSGELFAVPARPGHTF